MNKSILVPLDGSEAAFKAIKIACKLTQDDDKLVLVHVVRHRHPPEELKRYLETEHAEAPIEWEYDNIISTGILDDAKTYAASIGADNIETIIKHGDPAKMITKFAEENQVDMIVMGNRGIGKFNGIVFGSVSQKVSHLAKCTVITVS